MKVVEMSNITKEYPLVKALDKADLIIENGEIHALLGENGAGKSTLMKVLYGMVKPNEGTITIKGEKVDIPSPLKAIELGIGMVHQHFMLAPVLTVLENIIAGAEPKKGSLIDYVKAKKDIEEMAQKFGFNVDVNKRVEELSVGEKQRVEILKVLYRGAEILILDEPTAVLTPIEVNELFVVLRNLKAQGKSIIIITHKLHEVLEISDKITVMRDGKVVGHTSPKEVDSFQLANMMVGRDVQIGKRRPAKNIGDVLFEVSDLTIKDKDSTILDNICFKIHRGEILGVAGVEGNGQTELIEAITGIRNPNSMNLKVDNKKVEGSVSDFIASGIGHIPEDRLESAVIMDMTIAENCILGYHRQLPFSKKGILNRSQIKKYGNDAIRSFNIKAPNEETYIKALSGGNQQKVVVSRVFKQEPKVVISAQPTRGVDVGAMEYIHEKMIEFRDEGNAVLLISADLQEVKTLSDRIIIMYKGKVVAEGKTEAFSDTDLGILMTGGELNKKAGENFEYSK
ncbi:ABC transporter ATP-binding protein [Proteiniborus sp. MB09-C3]|uniref:ABC transporter ATP-binding protein n=1 Tax=Proteiniborus sp. MB09-C3 TaxID=3050072 RepID=UPI00255645CA|nr:ABC transporter ATP-binding protein [Proteiniborus sp. MB09-C3]WIV13432.1 ABC transporter ATP-binding protein [Proteiniborus sp. MB09-C3]